MKKIIVSIFCIAVAISSVACIKSQKSEGKNQASTHRGLSPTLAEKEYFFVEDSTGALIPNATITFGHGDQQLTTSWDGRFVISPEQLANSLPVSITARGFDTLNTTLTQSTPHTLILKQIERVYDDNILYARSSTIKSRASGRADMAVKAMYDHTEVIPSPMVETYTTDEVAIEESGIVDKPAVANNISAGKLTAGEVNDFAKWHLWDKVINQSHKQFVGTWKIYTNQRYVAQVTNRRGFPITDMQVRLTDNQGNTLFSAMTDNTGRAELWLCRDSNARNEPVLIQVGNQKQTAKCFAEGLNQFVLNEECYVPSIADVFFIFDATGSMGDELRYLQAEMKDVIQRSQSAVEGLNIRTGALVYRDVNDDYVTRISRLSDDIQTTQNFIDAQQAGGGGDYEEAIPEAMMAAINAADWSTETRVRIAFLILDAPCHKDSVTVQLLREQVINAASMGIRIVPIVCSGLHESGELLMRSIALITNGTSFFLTDDSGIGDTHLKPTTDSLKVEHLNDMMVRTIISFTRMPECDTKDWAEDAKEEQGIEQFLPAPFDVDDLDSVPTVLPAEPTTHILQVRPNPCKEYCLVDMPKGVDALWLCDVSGKTIRSFVRQDANTQRMRVDMSYLSTGVYFFKTFYSGQWHTAKVIKAQR